MTYKLAKELKDAGFPYKKRRVEFLLFEEGGKLGVVNRWQRDGIENKRDNVIPIPTLSELIEACGEKFQSIMREVSSFNAIGKQFLYDDPQSDRMLCGGSTPEEAVARLWLALNKSETKD